jgi:tetratricopeptide (TPR) repeat protein
MPEDVKTIRAVADRREIRVFISSTFRDMQEEREELVKQIFPQLRRVCESRGVTWGEVDLRWGVPDEAKAEGKVLPLCLQEIEHCRPYFIGLLGERYGWVPEEIPESLFETQPWLREHLHQSVTALEILHGVLLDQEMDKHAFFYFRDPAYAAAHPGFTEEDRRLRERLEKLKDDIRKSGIPVSEPFATPKQLGEWVLRDLTAVIEEIYPEKTPPNPLDQAAFDHEAYSASRRTVYIGRQEYMDRLDAHATGDGLPLVIAGESGGGKSALLANWAHSWSEQHPETPVLVHFIGAAPDSANWRSMLRRLLGEFQRKFGIQIEIPDQPDALRMAFANALHMVAARGRLVLVLDALNQIEDRDGATELVWLPPVIPANVRLILSTLPGRSWEDLKKRGWPKLTVEPLTVPEREEMIVKYLKRFSKELSPGPARRIAAAPQTGNGLYLSTLLNELRQFGSYEQLNKRIDWYLRAASPVELYGKVIRRWEKDYDKPLPSSAIDFRESLLQRFWRALRNGGKPSYSTLVRESLVRLWTARRGLSETELLESLGTAGSPLSRALWSPLHLAAGDSLVNRGGLLTFTHEFLRLAVQEVYLPAERHREGAHRILADYFNAQPQGPRQLDELPWQWQQSADWQKLANLMAKPGFFNDLWNRAEFEVKAYWTGIESHSPMRIEQVYDPVIQDPIRDKTHAWLVAQLLLGTGKPEAALHIYEVLVDYFRWVGDSAHLQGALGNQAAILLNRGDQTGAMALQKEQELLCRKLGDVDGLQCCLGNQAAVLFLRGNLDGAKLLFDEQERLCREMGQIDGLSKALNGRANILQSRGDFEGAIALHKEEEHLYRELGNKDGIQTSLGGQANAHFYLGDLDGAMALYREQACICRELSNKHGLSKALGGQAGVLSLRNDLDGARVLLLEQVRLCRDLGNKNDLQITLGNLALILHVRGDLDGALSLCKEQERICRELDNPEGISVSLAKQAMLISDFPERKEEARRLAQEALEIATRHGYPQWVDKIQLLLNSFSV